MEKTLRMEGDLAAARQRAEGSVEGSAEDPREHLRIWREIYRDVRRQWIEAEHGRRGRYSNRP